MCQTPKQKRTRNGGHLEPGWKKAAGSLRPAPSCLVLEGRDSMKCQYRFPQTTRQAAVIEKAEYQGPKNVSHNMSRMRPRKLTRQL